MTAYVTIPISGVYNVVRVRKEALRASPGISEDEKRALLARHGVPPPGSDPNKGVLWLAEGNSYRPIAVTIGTTDYVYAEITSGNVKEGQRVLAGYRRRDS